MNKIDDLSVRELLVTGEYRIPIYQRNYAWGISETTQLIQDIADYAKDSNDSNDSNNQTYYYIGNLIVFPRFKDNQQYFETIDGQQRLTTLTILICALRLCSNYDFSWYKRVNVSFDYREKSNYTLSVLFNPFESHFADEEKNTAIMSVFNKARFIVDNICNDKGIQVSEFISYLLDNVKILRVCVPEGTNLNHYFEIMNSRGEQLEQHEIIKARLMSIIKDDNLAMAAFNLIWEACSDMNRYVQMNFDKKVRSKIFDNNGSGPIKVKFDEIKNILTDTNIHINESERSLYALFNDSKNHTPYNKPWEENKENETPESYNSIISFSNFLLHVLKLINTNDENVVLDDKRLTKIFDEKIEKIADKVSFVKVFIMELLRTRYLFDTYIIKRHQDRWSLKRLSPQRKSDDKYYYKDTFSPDESEYDTSGINKRIIMILSMFHVSAPTQIYKHWMSAALMYLHNQEQPINAEDYFNYLWNLSKAYMLDRYLAADGKKLSFEEIIYSNEGKSQNTINDIYWGNINIEEYPHVGEHVENFVFNFYDFLLYNQNHDNDYEFTYRTSVEHFYPQHPTDREPMDFNHLHSFGNLCLVSRGMNSKFTNNLPGAKAENFGSIDAMKSYSIKLKSMINCVKNHEIWDEQKISQKENEAKELIIKMLSANNIIL